MADLRTQFGKNCNYFVAKPALHKSNLQKLLSHSSCWCCFFLA